MKLGGPLDEDEMGQEALMMYGADFAIPDHDQVLLLERVSSTDPTIAPFGLLNPVEMTGEGQYGSMPEGEYIQIVESEPE